MATLPPILCQHCKARPVFVENGKAHPFCGKTCASNSLQQNAGTGIEPFIGCMVCGVKPRYADPATNKMHPYCGRTCAGKVGQKGSVMCAIAGCNKPVYVDPNGKASETCSNTHKKLAYEGCLMCRMASRKVGGFCSKTCLRAAQNNAPCLLKVPNSHAIFKSVSQQFTASWRHTNRSAPTVRKVFKVVAAQPLMQTYEKYRDAVEARRQFKNRNRPPGNEQRRWHGTTRQCSLGEDGASEAKLCGSAQCALCNIIRTSFDLAFFATNTSWGRFGKGIYTSSTSSKSDAYIKDGGNVKLKAILLNKVVVGKGRKLTVDNPTLTAPPVGFDSVLAEKGANLNHDELIVYMNDAARPAYLVMYDR